MSWTQPLLDESYPIGSLWWMGEDLVKVTDTHLGQWGRAFIYCRRLRDDFPLEVDGNADPPLLEGPTSPLEALGEQAE